ncbi:carbonic anhydrase [Asanoa ishikariensis]|uniref:carbonic anhydrase n=1 Tax=Asanoa ishikariensis TaxID=137265 RepID=A0A1H3UHX3_9ACTN|nr:carbonic anhydrase [Asanoa ishikariensis]GIF63546.1 carbonic anhydrase [Asanoa ishikariensis]SDZ61661.1 carbonic anhydrase [Asanoa ishikariensis]
MIDTDELVRRNAAFAAGEAFADVPLRSAGALRLIGCVDPRVDPAHVLGLHNTEAVVMRNVGGRVTPEALRSWAMLAKVAQARGAGLPRAGGHLVVLHHTDCGITDLAAFPDLLAEYFEIPAAELPAKAVLDPYTSVRLDVDLMKQALPPGIAVSGLVYDVHTGLIEVVVPPVQPEG